MYDLKAEKRKEFYDNWSAYFRPLAYKDGLKVWYEWIDNPSTDIETMIEAIRNLGESDARSPRLGNLKSAYYHVIGGQAPKREKAVFVCPKCQNRGYGWLVIGIRDGKRLIAEHGKFYDSVIVENFVCWYSKCWAGNNWIGGFTKMIAALESDLKTSGKLTGKTSSSTLTAKQADDRGQALSALLEEADGWKKMQRHLFFAEHDARSFRNELMSMQRDLV